MNDTHSQYTEAVEEVDLFADDLDDRLNLATASQSSIASGSSVSTAGTCWCSFSSISSACCSG